MHSKSTYFFTVIGLHNACVMQPTLSFHATVKQQPDGCLSETEVL